VSGVAVVESAPMRRIGSPRLTLALVLSLVALVLSVLPLAAAGAEPPRPRLVVVLSVDQFPRELVDRYAALFPDGGFRRFFDAGADYPNCEHRHYLTLTGPGHSVIMTGTYPVQTGIVANRWYSRRDRKMVGCVEDERFPSLDPDSTEPEKGFSPMHLRASTVGDVLRASTVARAKAVSIALKDRAAVLMGGWRPNGAFWIDEGTCRFTSSRYYSTALPAWVTRFNEAGDCKSRIGGKWVKFRPDLDYEKVADVDDAPYERDVYGLGRVFPHPLTEGKGPDRYAALAASPVGNELVLAMAKAAIEGEEMGRDDVPDVLTLGFSSNDYVGHAFGPHSQEVLDMTLRTDRLVADLMEHLDRVVGEQKWVMAIVSDHGVAPVPEYLEKIGVLAPREDHYRWSTEKARRAVERALSRRFFAADAPPSGFPGFFAAWDDATSPFVWIEPSAPEHLPGKPSFDTLVAAVRDEISRIEGVAHVFTSTERGALAASRDAIAVRVDRTWDRENGGDLVVQLEPYWFPGFGAATTHGSPYSYDTRVPMLLYGAGIHPGRYVRPVAVADLAPTLASLLGIPPPPECQGEPLLEALAP
jgi:predicted AlkP superfamily pyrophosphatase or phosphodiesterase